MDLLRTLETFVVAAEARSLSDAARQLSITPSAVSKQIAALEADLGVILLARTTRGYHLTTLGEDYLRRASRILADLREARDVTRGSLGGPRGILRISAPATFGRLHVATAIPSFMKQYPDVRVELKLYDRQADPVPAGVDVSIRMGRLRDSTMIAVKLAATRRVLCGSPGYFAQYGVPKSPEDLCNHSCLISTLYTVRNMWYFRKGGETRSVAVNGAFTTNNSESLREVALQGVGLALLGTWAVAPHLESGALVPVLTDWLGEVTRDDRNLFAVYSRAARASPNVKSFISFLRSHYGSPPYWERFDDNSRALPETLPPVSDGSPAQARRRGSIEPRPASPH